MAFGDRPKVGTLNAEGKPVRFADTLPEGPDYPWWHDYLMDEWKRRNHLTDKRTALPGFMAKDRKWAEQQRIWDAHDGFHRPVWKRERHNPWGDAAPVPTPDETPQRAGE